MKERDAHTHTRGGWFENGHCRLHQYLLHAKVVHAQALQLSPLGFFIQELIRTVYLLYVRNISRQSMFQQSEKSYRGSKC